MKFKQYLLESVSIKSSRQKALGLKHLVWNTYSDRNGGTWYWEKSYKDFIKMNGGREVFYDGDVIKNPTYKDIQSLLKDSKDRKNYFSWEMEGRQLKGGIDKDDNIYVWNDKFNHDQVSLYIIGKDFKYSISYDKKHGMMVDMRNTKYLKVTTHPKNGYHHDFQTHLIKKIRDIFGVKEFRFAGFEDKAVKILTESISIKSSKALSLGLSHVIFNTYKDKQNQYWKWEDSISDFIQRKDTEGKVAFVEGNNGKYDMLAFDHDNNVDSKFNTSMDEIEKYCKKNGFKIVVIKSM